MKSIRDLKTKEDAKLPKPTILSGTMCEVTFYQDEDGTEKMTIAANGTSWNLPTRIGIQYFKKIPTMKLLEKWTNDSVCLSVNGKRVEPDGHGPDGSPSWLLALCLI
jgi:hypothetical protein